MAAAPCSPAERAPKPAAREGGSRAAERGRVLLAGLRLSTPDEGPGVRREAKSGSRGLPAIGKARATQNVFFWPMVEGRSEA